MIAPTFEPNAAPGGEIAAFDRGVDQRFSWMDKAHQQRTAQQEEEMNRQKIAENQILLPVRQATAIADVAKAHSAVESAKIIQLHRAQAAVEAPKALQEFLDITKIENLDERAAALDEHAAKVSWLADLPEYKPLYDSIKDAQGKTHLDAIAMGKIAQMKDAVTMRAQTAEAQIEQRAKAAEDAARAKVEMQAQELAHKREVDELNLKIKEMEGATKRDVATTQANATSQRPANQAAVKANETKIADGQTAAQELARTNVALEILNDPTFSTGTGTEFALKAKRLGALLGADVGDAPKAEQLQSMFGDVLLAKAKQMKGNFSDKDREAIEKYSPSLAKTPEGNKALMTMLQKGYEQQVEVARMINEGRRQGLSEREVQLEVNDYILNHPVFGQGASSGGGGSGLVIKSVKKIE